MSKQPESERESTPRRRGRRFLVWIGGTAAVLLGLMLLGVLYESTSEAADARAYPRTGQMVDVGGYRLNINCVGTGSPTVVIDYGWGDSSASWSSYVQPGAAKTTRVCTYDRAGTGYSEVGPHPRSAEQFAQELHTLLDNGGVPAPYVVVGHSMGGLTAQVFAHDYAAEVAGVVLIDSMGKSAAKPSATGTQDTPPQSGQPSSGDWLLTIPARLGLVRLLSGPSSAATAVSVTPRYAQTVVDEGRGMPEGLAQAGAVKSLGSVPLIVLSRGLDEDEDWQKTQTELLQLSSNSKQLFADKSGHNVQTDQPEAAVGAIVQMVEQIRGNDGQATMIVATLALVLPAAPPVHAAGLVNCIDQTVMPGRAACYEVVWANGVQLRMTFANLQYAGATPSQRMDNFYVVAPQTDTPQGALPFPHDHVVGDVPRQNQGDYGVLLHGFLVFCSAQGIASGGCVPFTSATPGDLPLARTANGQPLTSVEAIESAANSGLLTLVDTGGVFIATINPVK